MNYFGPVSFMMGKLKRLPVGGILNGMSILYGLWLKIQIHNGWNSYKLGYKIIINYCGLR